MTLKFDRGAPPAVVLALLGGVLALGALLLPWFVLSEAAMQTLMRSLADAIGNAGGLPVPKGVEMDAALSAAMPTILDEASREFVGYRAFSPLSIGLHALAGAGAIWAGLRVWSGESSLAQQRGELFGAAGLVALRPVLALVQERNVGDIGAALPGVVVPNDLVATGTGVYVALAGAGLILAAAIMAKEPVALAGAAPAWAGPVGEPTGAVSPPPGAFVPGAPAMQATAAIAPAPPAGSLAYPPPAQPVFASPPPAPAAPPTYSAPAPSRYTPGSAYGDEGPSTLDRDSRLVRPNDPYAPPPMAAPAVPIMPAPAAIMPLHDPAPVTDVPGSTYGVPVPPPPAPPPRRSGSTAPPGFG